jgi:hypothetical protein
MRQVFSKGWASFFFLDSHGIAQFQKKINFFHVSLFHGIAQFQWIGPTRSRLENL